jgi:hypothetical protein
MDTAYDDWAEPQHRATYSPEDNKLRIYPSGVRLDKELGDEYASFKAAGYKWAPKQECFVCARWTPTAEDWALRLAGEIDDEDYSYEERAADRAERFETYRDKRADEAGARADAFEAGPAAFGHQSRARAERQARRHDRHRTHAVSQWSKAEYWQRRTAGVISHALYKSSPEVRRGRIKVIEAQLRAEMASYTPVEPIDRIMQTPQGSDTPEPYVWCGPKGRGGYWVRESSLERRKAGSARWVAHYELRLAYERAMLAEEGGCASDVEMVAGGFIGRHQVLKVNKSPATGRVVSVAVWGPHPYLRNADGSAQMGPQNINIERLGADAYRAPTDEELAEFTAKKKAAKKAGPTTPLVNPTDEDAERLQAYLNAQAVEKHAENRYSYGAPPAPKKVERVTQAYYSRNSGDGCIFSTKEIEIDGQRFKVRTRFAGFGAGARHVVVLTDKPQKPLPITWPTMAEPAEAGCLF